MITGLHAYNSMTDMARTDNRPRLLADIWAKISMNLQDHNASSTKSIQDSMTLINDGLIGSLSDVDGSELPAKLLDLYRWYYQTLSKQIWARDEKTILALINIAKTQEDAWRQIA